MLYLPNFSLFCLFLAMFSRIGTALVRSPVKTAARGYSYRHFATNYKESDSLKIDVTASESYQFSGDLIAIPFYKPNDAPKEDQALADALKALIPDVGADLKSVIGDVLDEYSFKADASSKKIVRIFGNNSVKYLALIGLGKYIVKTFCSCYYLDLS